MSTVFDVGVRMKFGVDGVGEVEKAKKALGGVTDAYKKDLDWLNKNKNRLPDHYRSALEAANQAVKQGQATLSQSLRQTMSRDIGKTAGTTWGSAFVAGIKEALDRGKQQIGEKLKGIGQLANSQSNFGKWDNAHGLQVGVAGGQVVKATGRKLFDNSADIEQLRVNMETMGLNRGLPRHGHDEKSYDWRADIEAAAERISAKNMNISKAGAMNQIIESINAMGGNVEHAIEFTEKVGAQLGTVLGTLKAGGRFDKHVDIDHLGFELAKYAEMRLGNEMLGEHGVEKSKDLLDSVLKQIVMSQGRFDANAAFQGMKGLKFAQQALSDDFVRYTFPTLIQELKAKTGDGGTGNAVLQLFKQLTGGKMTGTAAMQLGDGGETKTGKTIIGLRLLNPDGSIKGVRESTGEDGKFDPKKWVDNWLSKAMEGMDDATKNDVFTNIASNQNSGAMLAMLLNQRQRLDNEMAAAKRIGSIDELVEIAKKAPSYAIDSLKHQLTNLWAALGDPVQKPALAMINGLASALTSLGQAAKDNPLLMLLGGGALAGAGVGIGAKVLGAMPGGKLIGGAALSLGLGGGMMEALLAANLLKSATGGVATNVAKAGFAARIAAGGFKLFNLALLGLPLLASRVLRLTTKVTSLSGALTVAKFAAKGLMRALGVGLLLEGLTLVIEHWSTIKKVFSEPLHLKVLWPTMPKWLEGIVNRWQSSTDAHNAQSASGQFTEGKLGLQYDKNSPYERMKAWWSGGSKKLEEEQRLRDEAAKKELERIKLARHVSATMTVGQPTTTGQTTAAAQQVEAAAAPIKQAGQKTAHELDGAGSSAAAKIDGGGTKVEASLDRLAQRIEQASAAISTASYNLAATVSSMGRGALSAAGDPSR